MSVESAEEAKDVLYGHPVETFIRERDALVTEVRGAGNRELANEIKTFRKPSAVAAEVNRVVRSDPDGVALILQAAALLREAQQGALEGSPIDAGALQQQYRAAIQSLAQNATSRKVEVRSAIEAATIDEDSNDDLRAGTLVAVPTPESIFGFSPAPASKPASPKKAAPKKKEVPKVAPKDELAERRAKREQAAAAKADTTQAAKKSANGQAAAEKEAARQRAAAEKQTAKEQREREKEEARQRKERQKVRQQQRKQLSKDHREAVRAHLALLDAEAAASIAIDDAQQVITDTDDAIAELQQALEDAQDARQAAADEVASLEQSKTDNHQKAQVAEQVVEELSAALDELDALDEADS